MYDHNSLGSVRNINTIPSWHGCKDRVNMGNLYPFSLLRFIIIVLGINFRILDHFIYVFRCALKNEEYNNRVATLNYSINVMLISVRVFWNLACLCCLAAVFFT